VLHHTKVHLDGYLTTVANSGRLEARARVRPIHGGAYSEHAPSFADLCLMQFWSWRWCLRIARTGFPQVFHPLVCQVTASCGNDFMGSL